LGYVWQIPGSDWAARSRKALTIQPSGKKRILKTPSHGVLQLFAWLLAVGCQGVQADSVRYRGATFHHHLTEEDRADWR
jgi:hypothetical protein